MSNEQTINIETINVVQQVLKGVALSIAGAARADLAECATHMQAFVQNHRLDPLAVSMLLYVAQGFDMLAKATRGQTNDA